MKDSFKGSVKEFLARGYLKGFERWIGFPRGFYKGSIMVLCFSEGFLYRDSLQVLEGFFGIGRVHYACLSLRRFL